MSNKKVFAIALAVAGAIALGVSFKFEPGIAQLVLRVLTFVLPGIAAKLSS